MKFLNCFFSLIGFLIAMPVQALPTLEKGLLSNILPDLQIVFDGQKDLPVYVRVVGIPGDGECQDIDAACDNSVMYVVISDNEALPVTSVTYNLGKAHVWDLKSVSRCTGPQADLCVNVVVDQTMADASTKSWKHVHHGYEFRMGSVKEIESRK